MTIAILSLILIGYVLISTEHITNINKATIALFAGVVGWVLYICTGTDFILKMHGPAFESFASGAAATSELVKDYIARHVFIRYAADLGGVALYLLATMNIVSVLNTNGCFDFITDLVRTKDSRILLWGLVAFTCLLSVNLDNLTTTVLMMMIMRGVIRQTRWRMWIGAAIVIAANCSGAITVIGDVTSLFVWMKGAITPTDFTAALIVPALVATIIPTALIARALPENIDIIRPATRFRGDANTLRLWQRVLLLVVGLGGLWFIPTYHRITHLPPFLGAMCVLGVLWVAHEIMNRRRIRSGQPLDIRGDLNFQYSSMQSILYVVGIFLCVSLLVETGIMASISDWCDHNIHDIYIMSVAMGLISAVLDNIALVLTAINIYPVAADAAALASSASLDPAYAESFVQNGQYWYLIIYSGCVAGCLLPIGNVSGYTLMKVEDVSIAWYARHIMPKVLVGWLVGLGTYFLIGLL